MGRIQHYCAFCRNPKHYYAKSKIGFFGIFCIFLMSALFSYGFRRQVDEYLLYIFFGFLLLIEISVKLRFRLSLRCKECGFDPLLYKQSPQTACMNVRAFIEERNSHPENLLKRPLLLPKIPLERQEFWKQMERNQLEKKKQEVPDLLATTKKGRLLSREL